MSVFAVDKLMHEARILAAQYRKTTGNTLGISAEIATYDAARLLGLEVLEDKNAGIDAVGKQGKREGLRYIVKGRTIFDEGKSGHRLGQMKLDKEWDAVALVLMDEEYEPFEIYEASREEIEEAIDESASSKRSKRGPISVAKFKVIGTLVWTREEGPIDDEVWDNQADA